MTEILDFVIIFLLITAIVYGFMLNKRIKLIQQSRKELANLFKSFDDTILRAQGGIEDLKRISEAVSGGLQKKIDKAVLMLDDLTFMGEKASEAADRIGNALSSFKKMESKFPLTPKSRPIAAMPLVTEQPRMSKSIIPDKPLQKKKALADLLSEISGTNQEKAYKAPVANNGNVVGEALKAPAKVNDQVDKNIEKKQFSIASALKALGYGD